MSASAHRIAIWCLVFLVTGCSHRYTANETTFAVVPPTPIFAGNQSVAVVNVQPSGPEVKITQAGIHSYYADLRAWTESAVRLVKAELTKQNITVADDAPKVLKVSVPHVGAITGFWVIRFVVTVTLETGDGEVNSFTANNLSPWTLYRSMDGALMRAVALTLNSDQLKTYLGQ